jgi:hypothetical protein
MTIATALYYAGIDPFTKQQVYVAKRLRDRKMQRALMQFFKPENWFAVRGALTRAGRQDLIGNGCDCLIPAQPPKEAIEARRRRANGADHYHSVANPAKGERPGDRGLPNKGIPAGAEGRPPLSATSIADRFRLDPLNVPEAIGDRPCPIASRPC